MGFLHSKHLRCYPMSERIHSSNMKKNKEEEKGITMAKISTACESPQEKNLVRECLDNIAILKQNIWHPKSDKKIIEMSIPFRIRKDVAIFMVAFFQLLNLDLSDWLQRKLECSLYSMFDNLQNLSINGLDPIVKQLKQKLRNEDHPRG